MASSDDVGLSQSGIKCRRCGGSSLSSWDLFLPITRRGSFFQDSFFSNIHHDFDAAIREVLGRWNEPDLKVTDSRDDVSRRYRRLRSQNMNEESQAVTVTSDNTGHKVRGKKQKARVKVKSQEAGRKSQEVRVTSQEVDGKGQVVGVKVKSQESRIKSRDQESRVKNQESRSKVKSQESRVEIKSQESRIKSRDQDQESRIKSQESRVESQESRIKSQEPRAESQGGDIAAQGQGSQKRKEGT
ncbi:PC4 and SFRS1-interacting protein-like [Penaeus indicus]|uniref:PC4 and SFRS1-interacting protein-like n=1 Tax=Penaeus indicus TaxID=29960 RepID=UPI00300C58B9